MNRHLIRALSCLALAGCPEPEPEPDLDGCPADGATPGITLRPNRGDRVDLTNGGEVPVFDALQGGIFTELDVEITGVAADTLQELRVDVVDTMTSAPLAAQLYFGDGLPLSCLGDGVLFVPGLPVGFTDGLSLPELDQRSAQLTVRLVTDDQTITDSYAVVLAGF